MNDIKITHNQFIGNYENVLSEEDCKNIIKLFEEDLKNKIDNNGDTQFFRDKMERHDYQKFYPSSDKSNKIVSVINNALDKCIALYAEEFWIVKQLKATSLDIKLQKTPPRGGYHVWHCEQGSQKDAQNRAIVWTVYLNDIPDGEGETEFLWQGLRVKPKAGTVCIFPASFTHTHRGNPVYSCDKYIATGWYTLYE
jgi:hypothetical protein